MPIRPGAPQAPARAQGQQRRANPAERGTWVRQVLGFSRKPAPALAASDAQERPARARLPADVIELRDEISALVLDFDHEHAASMLRPLVLMRDELGRRGWAGVEALPATVLRRARVQAEMLAGRHPSPLVADLVERLQLAEVAAGEREGTGPLPVEPSRRLLGKELAEMSDSVEVSDTSFDDYEEMERGWVDTVPSELGKTG